MSTRPHVFVALAIAAVLTTAGCSRQEPAAPEPTPAAAASTNQKIQLPVDVGDARLETAVRLALLERLGVQSMGVGVDVTGSEVTLSGDVPTPADKDVALETARGVEGVGSVTDELGVATVSGESEGQVETVSEQVQNEILASRVKLALFGDMDAAAFDIDVDASQGEVTLHGTVPDESSHKLAVATARSTDGVNSVVDDLTVQPIAEPGPYTKEEPAQ